jgi:hypothetical protein
VASAHLREMRRSAERGAPPPPAPDRPRGAIPDSGRAQAQRLAAGFDQLAAEVAARLSSLEQLGSSSVRRSPHQEPRPARFIDIPV